MTKRFPAGEWLVECGWVEDGQPGCSSYFELFEGPYSSRADMFIWRLRHLYEQTKEKHLRRELLYFEHQQIPEEYRIRTKFWDVDPYTSFDSGLLILPVCAFGKMEFSIVIIRRIVGGEIRDSGLGKREEEDDDPDEIQFEELVLKYQKQICRFILDALVKHDQKHLYPDIHVLRCQRIKQFAKIMAIVFSHLNYECSLMLCASLPEKVTEQQEQHVPPPVDVNIVNHKNQHKNNKNWKRVLNFPVVVTWKWCFDCDVDYSLLSEERLFQALGLRSKTQEGFKPELRWKLILRHWKLILGHWTNALFFSEEAMGMVQREGSDYSDAECHKDKATYGYVTLNSLFNINNGNRMSEEQLSVMIKMMARTDRRPIVLVRGRSGRILFWTYRRWSEGGRDVNSTPGYSPNLKLQPSGGQQNQHQGVVQQPPVPQGTSVGGVVPASTNPTPYGQNSNPSYVQNPVVPGTDVVTTMVQLVQPGLVTAATGGSGLGTSFEELFGKIEPIAPYGLDQNGNFVDSVAHSSNNIHFRNDEPWNMGLGSRGIEYQ